MRGKFTSSLLLAALLSGLGGLAARASWGAEATTLPGGASSLHETYGDWTVNCALIERGEAKTLRPACTVSQEVFESKTRQRVAAMQVEPASSATNITLVLPFGVDLAEGAGLQVDQNAKSATLPFKTCLPAGCVATGTLDAKLLTALRTGKALQILIKASDNGKPTPLTLSLTGLGNAVDRAQTLLGIKK